MTPPTGLILDDLFTFHDTGSFHVETAGRIRAIVQSFEDAQLFNQCTRHPPVPAPVEWIKRNHTAEYIQRLEQACRSGAEYIDTPDSAICPRSCEVALYAAGSALRAVDLVMDGSAKNFFVAARPPGHHAEADRSMGFCLFNNAAIAARYLLEKHKLKRVAIIDWDVHHGNGTQHSFEDSSAVFYCSLHGNPMNLYPGTGFEWEHGTGPGEGFTLNAPLLPGSGDAKCREAFNDKCRPELERFKPQFVIVSAGFDAHKSDPIGNLAFEDQTFVWLTEQCLDLASTHAGGRLISVLEGGYNLETLGRLAALHFSALCRAAAF